MKLADVDYLKLISMDKKEFIISSNAILLCSGLIKMVEEAISATDRIVVVPTIYPKAVLRCVLDYIYFKLRYISVQDYNSIPSFKIPPNIVLEVFKAAKELGI